MPNYDRDPAQIPLIPPEEPPVKPDYADPANFAGYQPPAEEFTGLDDLRAKMAIDKQEADADIDRQSNMGQGSMRVYQDRAGQTPVEMPPPVATGSVTRPPAPTRDAHRRSADVADSRRAQGITPTEHQSLKREPKLTPEQRQSYFDQIHTILNRRKTRGTKPTES